jgi:predicted nucleic acid-binding Zn ribbon protein
MSVPAAPLPVPRCTVCGTEVEIDSKRCPSCGLARPAARGSQVLGRTGLWMLAGVLLAVYGVVLIIVAAAR